MRYRIAMAAFLLLALLPAPAAGGYFGPSSTQPIATLAVRSGSEATAYLGPLLRAAGGEALSDLLAQLKVERTMAVGLVRIDGRFNLAFCVPSTTTNLPRVMSSLKAVGRSLKRVGLRRFVIKLVRADVYAATSKQAIGWMQQQRESLFKNLDRDPKAFRLELKSGAAPKEKPLLPLDLTLSGRLGGDAQLSINAEAAAAIRTVFLRPSTPELDFLPADVQVVSRIHSRGPLLAAGPSTRTKRDLPALVSLVLSRPFVVALMREQAGATRLALYIKVSRSKAQTWAVFLYRELGRLQRALGAKLYDRDAKGRYRLELALPGALRAALASLGLTFPRGLSLWWAAAGDRLVVATDPAILAARPRRLALPAELASSPLWSWSPATKQRAHLARGPAGLVLHGGGNLRLLARLADRTPRLKASELVASIPALVLGQLLRDRLVQAFAIPSAAMEPAVQVGDHLLVDRRAAARTPGRGDLVVFAGPRQPDKDFVKRVIGLPGDTVEVKPDEVLLNGKALAHKKCGGLEVHDSADGTEWRTKQVGCRLETLGDHEYPVVVGDKPITARRTKVPAGHVFVMGDNRPSSADSRTFGTVPVRGIKGRAVLVWFSAAPGGGAVRWPRIFLPLK
jgi:signal peptidase I